MSASLHSSKTEARFSNCSSLQASPSEPSTLLWVPKSLLVYVQYLCTALEFEPDTFNTSIHLQVVMINTSHLTLMYPGIVLEAAPTLQTHWENHCPKVKCPWFPEVKEHSKGNIRKGIVLVLAYDTHVSKKKSYESVKILTKFSQFGWLSSAVFN